MNPTQSSDISTLLRQQLDQESQVADAMEKLNSRMSALLSSSGIQGPSRNEIESLEPLMQQLNDSFSASRQSLEQLEKLSESDESKSDNIRASAPSAKSTLSLRALISRLPEIEARGLQESRQRVQRKLVREQQRLAATQVAIFYSMDFHRRYLLGVLQCDKEDANYQANGQAFKLAPEQIIGRNC